MPNHAFGWNSWGFLDTVDDPMVPRYDSVFGPESPQEDVYRCIHDCAKHVLEGKKLPVPQHSCVCGQHLNGLLFL